MQIALPELSVAATLTLDLERPLTDEEYFDFCAANSDLKVERTAKGEIVIVPPAGMESDHRNLEVAGELMPSSSTLALSISCFRCSSCTYRPTRRSL